MPPLRLTDKMCPIDKQKGEQSKSKIVRNEVHSKRCRFSQACSTTLLAAQDDHGLVQFWDRTR